MTDHIPNDELDAIESEIILEIMKTMSGTSMNNALFSEYGPTNLMVTIYAKELEKIDQNKQTEIKTQEQYKELAYKKLVPEIQQVIAENMPQDIHMNCGSNSDYPIEISCKDGIFYGRNPNNKEVTVDKQRLLACARLHNNATLEVQWEATEALDLIAKPSPQTKTYDLNQESELIRFFQDSIEYKNKASNTDKTALEKITELIGSPRVYPDDEQSVAKFTRHTIPQIKKLLNAQSERNNNY